MHYIEDGMDKSKEDSMISSDRVLIIDGMAVVNQIDFKHLETCKDFAVAFVNRLEYMASDYTEVRLIFDRYLHQSLKAKTRDKITAGVQLRYSLLLFNVISIQCQFNVSSREQKVPSSSSLAWTSVLR